LPFHTIPVGVVFKVKFALPLVFIKQKCLQILWFIPIGKNINIKDNFDLVLKLLLSSVFGFEIPKQVNQKIKLAEDNLEKSIKNEELQALLQIEKCLVFFMTSLKGMIFYCTESRI
jgi:magnesium transporter